MKKETRKKILALRDNLPHEERKAASAAAADLLFGFESFSRAGTVMFFVSFRSEIFTEGMIRRALSEGKRVVVPVSRLDDCSLLPSELRDFDKELAGGNYGIPEPFGEFIRPVDPTEIDFVLLPGAAFDRRGNRIGYGGGYYDHFIENLQPDTPLVALAFSIQVIDSVPAEEHDRKVDFIITEKEIITCK